VTSGLVTQDVAAAAAALRAGGLVAFPTETVYGLGALADDEAAVTRIFTVKGRPRSHPVIVHVDAPDQLDRFAQDVRPYARGLAAEGWPGPLTLIVPRRPDLATAAAGGADTVGIRCPAHPVALALITAVGSGVAAPSANRFGRVSPTSAAHVLAELGDRLDPHRDRVLDGGACPVGIESTIVDCCGDAPVIVRSGRITEDEIARWSGIPVARTASTPPAPGTLASHYAPTARVLLSDGGPPLLELIAREQGRGGIGLIAPAAVPDVPGTVRLAAPRDDDQYAQMLYASLRAADDAGMATVVVVPPPPAGVGIAVRDRLRRAEHGTRSAADG
jgi:L-threonylcarbamoyladenylate synthase